MINAEHDDDRPIAKDARQLQEDAQINDIKMDAYETLKDQLSSADFNNLFPCQYNAIEGAKADAPVSKLSLDMILKFVTPDKESDPELYYVISPSIGVLIENSPAEFRSATGERKRIQWETETVDPIICAKVMGEIGMRQENRTNLANTLLLGAAQQFLEEAEVKKHDEGYGAIFAEQTLIKDATRRAYWRLTHTELHDADWLSSFMQ
jgi:hypothetical protein